MTKTWAEKLADKENFPKIVKLERKDTISSAGARNSRSLISKSACGRYEPSPTIKIREWMPVRHGCKG